MACRVLLLAIVTTAFAGAWAGDQRHQDEVIAIRTGRATRTMADAASHGSRAPAGAVAPWTARVVLPNAIAPGVYRVISHEGAAEEIDISANDLARWGVEAAASVPAMIELNDDGRRTFLVRLSNAPTEAPARILRTSLEDGGLRPTRR